jgi:hypothetical protein
MINAFHLNHNRTHRIPTRLLHVQALTIDDGRLG